MYHRSKQTCTLIGYAEFTTADGTYLRPRGGFGDGGDKPQNKPACLNRDLSVDEIEGIAVRRDELMRRFHASF